MPRTLNAALSVRVFPYPRPDPLQRLAVYPARRRQRDVRIICRSRAHERSGVLRRAPARSGALVRPSSGVLLRPHAVNVCAREAHGPSQAVVQAERLSGA